MIPTIEALEFKELTVNEEVVGMNCIQSNGKVGYATEDDWRENTNRKLRYDFTKEISTDRIHVVVHFTQEYRSLIREDENDILNSVESDSHSHEEESTVSVLDTLRSAVTVLEKNDGEASSDDCNDKLHVRSLRKSHSVQKVSSNQET